MPGKEKIKILGPSVGYTDLLDHATNEKLQADLEKRRKGELKSNPLRPSSAGKCERALALELTTYRGGQYYEKPLMEPNVYRLLNFGHAVEFHALRQFQLIKVFEQRYKQQVLTLFEVERGDPSLSKEMLEGSCDFILWHPEHKCIGDVKSKKEKFSNHYSNSFVQEVERLRDFKTTTTISETALWIEDVDAFLDELGEDFMSDNFIQLNLYANSEFMLERGINHAVLYYYSKNTSNHFELRFKPSRTLYDKTHQKFNRISKLVDQGKLPERCEFTPGSMRYAFCDCHQMLEPGTKEPLYEWYATFPKKVWPTNFEKLSPSLQQTILEWSALEKQMPHKERLEEKIIKNLLTEKVKKVKIEEDWAFELKKYKTPREHFKLKRVKI